MIDIASIPEWVGALAAPRVHSANGDGAAGGGEMPEMPEGSRNAALFSLAGTMKRRGMPDGAIRVALEEINEEKCVPPLGSKEIEDLVGGIGRYESDPAAVPQPRAPAGIHSSDLGNARRLVAAHGADIRFVPPWKDWLVWNGQHWKRDETKEVIRRAKAVVNEIYADAARTADPDVRKSKIRFALKSEMEPRLRGMIELAKSEPGIPILPRALDTDPWHLCVENGTLDLRTGVLRESRRGDLITKLAPVRYAAEAKCRVWEALLDRIFGGNEKLIAFMQRAVGYSLTGSVEEQVFFLLYGTGGNGKSKFLEAIRYALRDYARQTDFTTFLETRSERIRNDLARLFGVRFVTAIEAKKKSPLDEAFVKQVTGGDIVTARLLYQEYFEFLPSFKVWLAANHKPGIEGIDEGIWRRVLLIPFTVHIPEPEQDKRLGEKLQGEAEGILRWAVEGCLEWQRVGLDPPPEIAAATREYREESDVLAGFLEERCALGDGLSVVAGEIYRSYCDWADQRRGETVMSHHDFWQALEQRGVLKDRKGGGGRVRYLGIGLDAVEMARLKDLKEFEGHFG